MAVSVASRSSEAFSSQMVLGQMGYTAPIFSVNFCHLACSTAWLLSLLLSSSTTSYGETTDQPTHTVTIQISSLFPSSATCKPSPTPSGVEPSGPTRLNLVHKEGPCDPYGPKGPINMTQILIHDQARVNSLFSSTQRQNQTTPASASGITIPARDGSIVNSGNYIVTLGLGTPKTDVSLIFDTGSDLTWTQCRPCARFCHKQVGPIFDPSKSKTFANISCRSAICSQLQSTTGTHPGCSSGTCVYAIQYGDQSVSVGFLSKDRLTLSASDSVEGFYFGCGQLNRGLFGGSGGLLGLGRDKLSFVSQTASKFGKVFSYCLPSTPSSAGHLTFGRDAVSSKKAAFTKLKLHSQYPSFYFLEMTGIIVGGYKLPIPTTIFSLGETLIDSGTVITRLQPTAYFALRAKFRQFMKRYPSAPALQILDTCYDLSGYSSVSVPKLAFEFSNGAVVDVDPSGILYPASMSQVCLAVAPNQDDSDVGIFGNMQQLTYNVVYDVAGGRLGFGSHGCN
uniref:Peptidase A1 domain-containing protein n=1 Tax=Kalanchoe fedtschenkoi TaxID=63787 RepID=A0A7N0V476_KALFE